MIPRYPLTWPDGWPKSPSRRPAKFSTTRGSSSIGGGRAMPKSLSVMDGISRVMAELRALRIGDNDVVISTNLVTRLDGLPRSDQREPHDPGVAVYWEDREKKMRVVAIDHYDRVADNLAAVAATLESLRAIERHGGARILERAFTGFDALPPPKSPWEILGCSDVHATEESIQAAFKSRARSSHPDAGGSENAFHELTVARDKALEIIRSRK